MWSGREHWSTPKENLRRPSGRRPLDPLLAAPRKGNARAFVKKGIQKDGVFVTCLTQVLDKLSYDSKSFKTGLPKHALCLIQIPLLETILAWHTLRKPTTDAIERSRLSMVRFVLQGNLCVLDYAKASEVAIKALKGNSNVGDSDMFPDQALMGLLCNEKKPTAYPLPSPRILEAIVDQNELSLTITSRGSSGKSSKCPGNGCRPLKSEAAELDTDHTPL